MKNIAAAFVAGLALAACGGDSVEPRSNDAGAATHSETTPETTQAQATGEADAARHYPAAEVAASLDAIGEAFVKLALGVGEHDKAFVDAYHGPAEWAEAAKADQRSLDALEADARGLLISIARAKQSEPGVRGAMLEKQLRAALTRIEMAQGETFTFNEETRLLYDAVVPDYDLAEFDAALEDIDALVPGDAPLSERVDAFRNSLAIPADRLQAVFEAAIAECRRRTLMHYDLPESERFDLEFVTDKPWSGYNWYQGDYESLIQVNTDFPIVIDRAVDLGCHEGYPGHHTWNIKLERHLLEEKGWIEYSVYPLFSPMSVVAEGSANYGIELAFPGPEKIAYEREVLFPLAGLDPAKADTLDRLNEARRRLSHARNHVAREYLDGRITRDEAIGMMQKYGLQSRERAEQGVRFIETYRGYVINYNFGLDLVSAYVEAKVTDDRDAWDVFRVLLSTPLAASDLAVTDLASTGGSAADE